MLPNKINPQSLKIGDKVKVCMCDTSATVVWSYPAIVILDKNKNLKIEALDKKLVNHIGENSISIEAIDGYYTFLYKL
jgi:hypothetical protein